MATILAHIQVHSGMEARFEEICAELYAQTHASEKGCRRYEYWRGAKPGLYYALLGFDDFYAFLDHQTSDHHESASPRLAEVIEGIELEWVDPIADASPLPATDTQPVPVGADAKMTTYHRIFGAKVQDWWQPLRAR